MSSRVVIVSRTGALGKLVSIPPGVLQVPEKFWFRPFVFWLGPKNILGDDRALVNQAPSGLGPSGFDRSLASLGCRTALRDFSSLPLGQTLNKRGTFDPFRNDVSTLT